MFAHGSASQQPFQVVQGLVSNASLTFCGDAFEKLVNNSIVDHVEKCGLFSNFWYGFRSSRSTADPLIADKLLGLLTGLGLLEL